MNEPFANMGKEESGIKFHLFSDRSIRILCNGERITPSESHYIFPAGRIQFKVYEVGNFFCPIIEETFFFSPGWSGCFLIKGDGVQVISEENLTVLPEKGHFRILNLLEHPITVRRMGGNEIFTDVSTVTPYRLAGVGRYRLQFFSGEEKIGERELYVNEGSHGSVIVSKEKIEYIEEFSI